MADLGTGRAWLKNRLKQVGRRQADLAAALGLQQNAISPLVNGTRKIAVHEVPAIAAVLDVSELDLLGRLGIADAAEAARERADERRVMLDRAALADVIAETLAWLDERRLVLSPADTAALIMALYELVITEKAKDPSAPVDLRRYADIMAPLTKRP